MIHAVLITVYKDFDYLIDLISMFDKDFYFFIHIDAKSPYNNEQKDLLRKNPNVKFLTSKYNIYWGSFNHILAIILLCEEALKFNHISYLHLISGHDVLVKNCNYFKSFFNKNKGKEFIEYFSLPSSKWTCGGLNRLEYYYPTDFVDIRTPLGSDIANAILQVQHKHCTKRALNYDQCFYGGSTWWSLTKECVEYVMHYLKNNSFFLDMFRHSFVPEEILFQTIIANSEFASNIINDNKRFITWEYRNGNIPAVLDNRDIKDILKSEKLFARKIDPSISRLLLEKLKGKL